MDHPAAKDYLPEYVEGKFLPKEFLFEVRLISYANEFVECREQINHVALKHDPGPVKTR